MSEPIKWLYYDITKARYVDDDTAEQYFSINPDSVLVEVHVDADNPLPSGLGVGLIPDVFPALIRQDGLLYEVTISGTNVNISSSGVIVQAGFLPYAGGTMVGDLILDHDPIIDLEAATKHYVDATISGSSVSGVIADAISSLIQVDLTLGTNLLVTNNSLPLNNITAVINGEDFVLGASSITMKDPGLYQISWNVVSYQSGTSAIRRRNLVCDLNLNSGAAFPVGSLGGTYSRSSVTSPYMNVGGDYIITTTSPNETVALRTRDLSNESNNGVVYQTAGGYLRIRLVRKTT